MIDIHSVEFKSLTVLQQARLIHEMGRLLNPVETAAADKVVKKRVAILKEMVQSKYN